jgi:hypothetical protein
MGLAFLESFGSCKRALAYRYPKWVLHAFPVGRARGSTGNQHFHCDSLELLSSWQQAALQNEEDKGILCG